MRLQRTIGAGKSSKRQLLVTQRELILGGQKSGKTARAEYAAAQWLQQSPQHRAVYIATALPWGEEMQARIVRHQQERAQRVPGMATVQAASLQEPVDVLAALQAHSHPQTLIVLDCLTLWLTQQRMPPEGSKQLPQTSEQLVQAIAASQAQLRIVGNEIGLGVIPLGGETRAFVDALGVLNQQVAAVCDGVTLMVAGLPLTVK